MIRNQSAPFAFQWGPFQFTDEDAEAHFLALGTTGSGKTLILRLLQQSVLSYVGQGLGYRGLCYDAKQDMYPILSAYCDPTASSYSIPSTLVELPGTSRRT